MKLPAHLLAAALIASTAGSAGAASFSYDYLEGGFGGVDARGRGNDDIIYLGGAKSLDPQFGLLGAVGFADYGASDGTVLRGGGLFHTSLQKDLDLFGTLELVYSDWDAPGNSDDLGVAAAAGLRYAVQDNFQLEGKLTVTEVDPFDDGLGLALAARFFLSPQLSAAAGVASDAEYDGIFINLRYQLK